ncbi:low specificity L-threonine aldolase [Coleofasciculus sp. FACHB-SPT36]|uniref:threonine aldolase family protein n=1 Tax=Cyanophyceae TaxID=3028117 RepID=UPI00168B9181|nr:low specificity L-threonine aldolase [Coleofasciculus sp. FACHB-SPT36]MBD2541013.1 low specificity L-threonine aldolase [Coleofasciculus sp. FACHB-SPT36]
MNFCSDNVTGISPEIMAAIAAANQGTTMPYGDDEYTQRLSARFKELFETDVTVFPVATGSAANALALSVITPPFGAIYCHRQSHINLDECGAPEFYTGGAKLVTLDGADGKIHAADLAAVLAKSGAGVVHHVQPAAVSLTQATEAGTIYQPEEISQIAEIAHTHNLGLHMDGARFANAVVSLGCSPADITWRVGVDVLSFGATKNGAMAAEAVVFFNQDLAKTFAYRRKRSGHLFSKMRFLSAQLEAYIKDDLWLKNAAHANQMAKKLAHELTALPGMNLCYLVAANEIFIQLPEEVIQGLLADGFQFYPWEGEYSSTVRLVTAFNTKEEDVTAFIEAARAHCNVVSSPLVSTFNFQ